MLPALRGGWNDFILDLVGVREIMFTHRSGLISHRLLKGTFAGFIATAPMSLTMLIGWLLLPGREKYHLPPRLITEEITARVGLEKYLNENQLIATTIASHFAYGAASGSFYALFEQSSPLPASVKGIFAGLAIWAGSYLGWLPAMDILPPATRHPWRRNLVMILAHVVWGVTLGEMTRKLTSSD